MSARVFIVVVWTRGCGARDSRAALAVGCGLWAVARARAMHAGVGMLSLDNSVYDRNHPNSKYPKYRFLMFSHQLPCWYRGSMVEQGVFVWLRCTIKKILVLY